MISLSPKRLSLRAALRQSISTFPKGLDSRACPGARLSFPLDMRYRVGVRSRLISLRFTLSGLPSAGYPASPSLLLDFRRGARCVPNVFWRDPWFYWAGCDQVGQSPNGRNGHASFFCGSKSNFKETLV